MKMIVAIIQDRDCANLLKHLTEAGYRSTKLASSGGFLRTGNTTVLVGVAEERVDHVLEIVHRNCKSREETMPARSPAAATGAAYMPFPVQVSVGGATIFVMDVDRFEKF